MNILISACLIGIDCRYNGSGFMLENIHRLKQKYNLIPFCPEIYGGLPTPREPCEIISNKVITKSGKDVTEQYRNGATEALHTAQLFDCKIAILKENSPSCGNGKIHSGNFDGKLIDGYGMTAKLLIENGIKVYGESQISDFLDNI